MAERQATNGGAKPPDDTAEAWKDARSNGAASAEETGVQPKTSLLSRVKAILSKTGLDLPTLKMMAKYYPRAVIQAE